MTRKKILVLCLALVLCMASTSAFAVEKSKNDVIATDDNDFTLGNTCLENEVITKATKWLTENYSSVYYIQKLDARIVDEKCALEKNRYTVSLACEMMYKYESVEEIPFVQGLMSSNIMRAMNTEQKAAVNAKIAQIKNDAAFGEYTEFCVDVVVEVVDIDDSITWKLYYQDGLDTSLHDIDVLRIDERNLYLEGTKAAFQIAEMEDISIDKDVTRGYSSYDRFEARNYARQYSSSPTTCDKCKGSCNILQDTSKWNEKDYPYNSVFLHNDCADFVSQAMSAGGIPEKSGWYRTKGSSGDWTNSWTVVSKLEAYMTRSDHVYWDESTFAACNAGNILITNSGGHVVMIDSNDGTTHKFTGHTNDRKSYVFGNVSNYKYYVINRNS